MRHADGLGGVRLFLKGPMMYEGLFYTTIIPKFCLCCCLSSRLAASVFVRVRCGAANSQLRGLSGEVAYPAVSPVGKLTGVVYG